MSEPNSPDPYFLQLVFMFQGAAYQHMGKTMNPATQKIERDLEQARHAIDLLTMLETKTKGNLSEDEEKLLEHTLFELRMNFVEEKNKGDAPSEDAAADEDASGDESSAEGPQADEERAPDDESTDESEES